MCAQGLMTRAGVRLRGCRAMRHSGPKTASRLRCDETLANDEDASGILSPDWHAGIRFYERRPRAGRVGPLSPRPARLTDRTQSPMNSPQCRGLIIALMIPGEGTLFHEESGAPAAAIPQTPGVYATDRPPFPLTDRDGREGIVFRAFREWAQTTAKHPLGLPLNEWPGWHEVPFDAQVALEAFLRVTDAASALAFAARYGPLWACTRHPLPCLWRGTPYGAFETECDWTNAEPLDWWLQIADYMRAVLVSAHKYKQGEELKPEDWRAMGYRVPEAPYGEGEGFLISGFVNGELQRYGVHVGLRWDLKTLELAPGLGFLPALWQQLASAIAGGRPMAICSACSSVYFRRRSAKRGQRNFCPACKARSAPQRLSRQARSRARGA